LGQASKQRLDSIKGMVPSPFDRPKGCPFHTRCESFMPGKCDQILPLPTTLGRRRDVRCLLYGEGDAAVGRTGEAKVLESVG
jgi:peptide/nickel transport system ATP-binding protein